MAETRHGASRKKSRAKVIETSAATQTPNPSPSVTTRSALSGKKAKKAAATAPQPASPPPKPNAAKPNAKTLVVAKAPLDAESPPSRKKKKRKRVHKRKGSNADALTAVVNQHDESGEPPLKKQAVKKATPEAPAKKTVSTTSTKAESAIAAAASEPQTDSKNPRSRDKKSSHRSIENQAEGDDVGKPETRRVLLSATIQPLMNTPQRGRLTRAAAAAAAAEVAACTPAQSTASTSDQSPSSSSKSKRKRKRSRHGRRDSLEPSPAADAGDEKLATNTGDPQAATADVEEKNAGAVALNLVKPRKTIISLVKVKTLSDAALRSPTTVSKSEPVAPSLTEDVEEKEEKGEAMTKSPTPKQVDAEQKEYEDDPVNEQETTAKNEDQIFDDAAMADQLVEQDTENEDVLDSDEKGEEDHTEISEHDEAVANDDSSDRLEEGTLSTCVELDEDEVWQSEQAEHANPGGDDEKCLETEDEKSGAEADDEGLREEGAEEEDVYEEEDAFEEDADDDEADVDAAEVHSSIVDVFLARHPADAPSMDGADSDNEQQPSRSVDDSESESGDSAQQASFSDTEEEKDDDEGEDDEVFQPGLDHYRFTSSLARSSAPANGAPEVIELIDSDSESDVNAESDTELHAGDSAPFNRLDGSQREEDIEEDMDEEEEEDEDGEEARWNGEQEDDDDSAHTALQLTSDPATSQTSDITEPSESYGHRVDTPLSGFAGWEQQTAAYGEREEAKTFEDTEEEDEATEDDESADEVVEVTSDQEEKEELVDKDVEVATLSPIHAAQVQDSETNVLESPPCHTKWDDHCEAVEPIAPAVPSPHLQGSSMASPVAPLMEHDASSKASEEPCATPPLPPVCTYSTIPSKQLLESVLARSPRAVAASFTQGASLTALPARDHSQTRAWGLSFGEASLDTDAPAMVAASRQNADASPLSSWFFSHGPADFKKRVVMPRVKETSVYSSTTPGSPCHRIGSPRPAKKPRLDAGTTDEEDTPTTRTDAFVQRLIESSSWRSWYSSTQPNELLDPPLPAAMIQRLGGEAALAMFSSSAWELTPVTQATAEAAEISHKPRRALATLEVAIQEEKSRTRGFDKELLQALQGKTLSGNDLADEFAPLLTGTAK